MWKIRGGLSKRRAGLVQVGEKAKLSPSLPPVTVSLSLPHGTLSLTVSLSLCASVSRVCFSVAVYVYSLVPAWLPVCQPMFVIVVE